MTLSQNGCDLTQAAILTRQHNSSVRRNIRFAVTATIQQPNTHTRSQNHTATFRQRLHYSITVQHSQTIANHTQQRHIINTYFRRTLLRCSCSMSVLGAYDHGFFSGPPFAAMFSTASGITSGLWTGVRRLATDRLP